ncbi:hypothetical protein GGI04_001135 [Coemansia thaxteri]|nr:hypothetical protein GGI04_001135 [Coemansia thaxteri]KAJ2472236.1 hypothetical protein GGI02_001715 [Coemansia sp. RSA 2322]
MLSISYSEPPPSAARGDAPQSATPQAGALPFDVLLAVCAQLPACECEGGGAAAGCTGHHAPGAFGGGALSALRQTSRAWRAAALRRGLRVVVASNRWMHGGDGARLAAVRRHHGRHVRRLVFRAADAFHSGRPGAVGELEAALALRWPCVDAVAVDWFSSGAGDMERIAAAVRCHVPRVRDFALRDKAATLAAAADMLRGAAGGVSRLALTPYGFNQQWAALQPAERGGADVVRRMRGQLTALGVGGADVTPALVAALHDSQPRLRSLAVEHASVAALGAGAGCLHALAALRLEHVLVGAAGELALSAAAMPRLASLAVRHVWRPADGATSARGAVSLQNERWLAPVWAQHWVHLRDVALPALADSDAAALPRACPGLQRLVTHSLDYAGPRLTAAGLVALLRGLPRLAHLAIEQRRADGSPGYDIAGAALCRLLGCADDDDQFGDRLIRRGSPAPDRPVAVVLRLRSLCIPHAPFTTSALDILVHRLPGLTRLAVTLRCDSLFACSPAAAPPRPHAALRRLALRADEDVLADPQGLAAWLAQRFPLLRECATNHARSHRRTLAELRALAPAVSFSRLSSRALQTTAE